MDSLRSALIQTGMFFEDEDGKLVNSTDTAARVGVMTDVEKLALMVHMHTVAVVIGKKPDGMSDAEKDEILKKAQATIGKLTVKCLNNSRQKRDKDKGKAPKAKKRPDAKTPYEKPSEH